MSIPRWPQLLRPPSSSIPIAHLEAGLRSFDRTMPEEINRVLVDQLARWCFTHSPEAESHLKREGIGNDRDRFRWQHDDRHAGQLCNRGSAGPVSTPNSESSGVTISSSPCIGRHSLTALSWRR